MQADPTQAFKAFLDVYGKAYAPGQFAERLAVFRANVDFIAQHNSQNAGYELGINQFADLTFDEFSETHMGLLPLGANGSYQYAHSYHLAPQIFCSPLLSTLIIYSCCPSTLQVGEPQLPVC